MHVIEIELDLLRRMLGATGVVDCAYEQFFDRLEDSRSFT